MAARTTVTGNLGRDAELRWTPSGSPVLELSIGCTPRKRVTRDSDQWEDDGAPLWINAPIWGQQAEALAEANLTQGTKVTAEGVLKRRTYDRRDGGQGEALELVGARFLGVIPKGKPRDASNRSQQPAGQANSPSQHADTGGQWNAPQGGSQNDPWATGNDRGPVPF